MVAPRNSAGAGELLTRSLPGQPMNGPHTGNTNAGRPQRLQLCPAKCQQGCCHCYTGILPNLAQQIMSCFAHGFHSVHSDPTSLAWSGFPNGQHTDAKDHLSSEGCPIAQAELPGRFALEHCTHRDLGLKHACVCVCDYTVYYILY